MKYRIFVFIVLILFLNNISAQNPNEKGIPFIKNFYPEDYNGNRQVWSCIEDERGIMYFGTDEQLLEYDGTNWRKLDTPEKMRIRSLTRDSSGVIYVGLVGEIGYLEADKTGTLHYKSLNNQIPEEEKEFTDVWRAHSTNEATYFMTAFKILVFKNKKFVRAYNIKDFENASMFFLIGSANNKIFIPVRGKGIYTEKNDSLVLLDNTNDIKEQTIFSILKYSKNEILLFDRNYGIFIYNLNTQTKKLLNEDNNEFFIKSWTYDGTVLPNGNFAFATQQKGIFVIDKNGTILAEYDSKSGLNDDIAWYIHAQRNTNNLWICHDYGISHLIIDYPVTIHNKVTGLKGAVADILRYNNTLFTATGEGIFYLKNNKFKKTGDFMFQCWYLLEYPRSESDEKMLLAATNEGFYKISKNKTERITGERSMYNLLIDKNKPDKIYVGFENGMGSFVYQNGVIERDVRRYKGYNQDVLQLEQGNDGVIWFISRYNGVGYVQNDSLVLLDSAKQLNTKEQIYIKKLNNKLYFQTCDGVFLYNKNKKRFEKDSSLALNLNLGNKLITFFECDSNQRYWLVRGKKENDWFTVEKKNQKTIIDTMIFKPISDEVFLSPGYIVETNGNYWLSTSKGFYLYNKNQKSKIQTEYNVLVRKVWLNNDSILYYGTYTDSLNQIILPYQYNSINFEYSSLFYFKNSDNKYRYKLEGFDKTWSNYSDDIKKAYTNLPEGDYVFKIQSKNIYGIESNITEYYFKILPPWYRTSWAIVLWIILSLLVIYIILKVYTYRLKRQKEILEQQVKERTIDLQEVNTKLEEHQAELLTKQEEILAQKDAIEMQNRELEKLSIVASKTDNAVIIMKPDGELEWCNSAFETFYGLDLESYKKQFGTNIRKISTYHKIRDLFNKCVSDKTSVSYESKAYHINGSETWLQTTITPILNAENEIYKLVAIDSDITKLKFAQEKINGSINYAQTIQKAILPLKERMDKYLTTFVLYLPKDVVSGDFYWFSSVNGYNFVAVVDCTGHGVPGAFMSMIGSSLLSEIINVRNIYEPAKILEELNISVIRALRQKYTDNKDGMDISICRFENNNQKVIFSGAKQSLLYYSAKEKKIERIKGTRKSIGGLNTLKNEQVFMNQEVILSKNDIIYMFTDGYIDQNNQQRKRFGTDNLKSLLFNIVNQDLDKQHNEIKLQIENYMKNTEQRDDITVIGIKII